MLNRMNAKCILHDMGLSTTSPQARSIIYKYLLRNSYVVPIGIRAAREEEKVDSNNNSIGHGDDGRVLLSIPDLLVAVAEESLVHRGSCNNMKLADHNHGHVNMLLPSGPGHVCSSEDCYLKHVFVNDSKVTDNIFNKYYLYDELDMKQHMENINHNMFMYCPMSHFPKLDIFIMNYCKKGGVQGIIKGWNFYFVHSNKLSYETNNNELDENAPYIFKIRYQIVNNRYCENVRRAHKSNHIGYEVNLNTGILKQFCWDPECKGFKSTPVQLPESILPNETLYLMELSKQLQLCKLCDVL